METSQELLHEVSRRFREGRVGIAMIDSLQARDTKFIQQLQKMKVRTNLTRAVSEWVSE